MSRTSDEKQNRKKIVVLQLNNTLICAHTLEKGVTPSQLWQEERISETSYPATVNVLGGKYAYNTVKQINALAQIPGIVIYISSGSQTDIPNWVARGNKISIEQLVTESGLFISRKNTVNWSCLSKEDQEKYRSHTLGDVALLNYICDKEEVSHQQLHYIGNTGVNSSKREGFNAYPVDSPIELNWSLNILLKKLGSDMLSLSKQGVFNPDRSYISGSSRMLASRQPLLKDRPTKHGLTVYGTGRTY